MFVFLQSVSTMIYAFPVYRFYVMSTKLSWQYSLASHWCGQSL